MRLVSLDQLVPDSMLGVDVHVPGAEDGPPLLRRGVALHERYIGALRGKGILAVWVDDALSEGMVPGRILFSDTERQAVAAVGSALSEAREALATGRGLSEDAMQDLQSVADLIAKEIHTSPDVGPHLADMLGADLGYPDGKAGDEIHQFARIAAVADVYDAVTADRPYRRAMAPHEGVKIIQDGEGTHFDPEVVAIFTRVVLPFPPGSEVVLADGRRAPVVDADPYAPYEPTVRVEHSNGSIEEITRAPLTVAMAA